MTLAENLAMAKLKDKSAGLSKGVKKEWKEEFIALLKPLGLGLEKRLDDKIDLLSGGQKQRVAVARALVSNPKLVLADEPTANLDHDTAYRIIGLMKRMRDEFGSTFVFSTHDPKIMGEAEVVFTLEDGRVREQEEKQVLAHA